MYELTALLENTASDNHALQPAYGLSFLLEGNGLRLLFDCGPGPATLANARRLGKSLQGLDAVILSHGHYDHAAGYRDLLEAGLGSPLLYTGPGFFAKKYAAAGQSYTNLSPGFDEAFVQRHGVEHRVCDGCLALAEGLWLIGGFPTVHPLEPIPARFVRRQDDPAGGPPSFIPDDFADEICLAADSPQGLVLLVGCAHPGLLNMVEHVHALLQRPIHALYGGTHLKEASEERILAALAALRQLGLGVLGLCHCSGPLAEELLQRDGSLQGCHLATGDTAFF